MIRASAILAAAGQGRRFGGPGRASASKVEFEVAGKPVLLHAIDTLAARPEVAQILVAVDPDRFDEFADRWRDAIEDRGGTLVPGGRKDRWETVRLALAEVDASCTHVAVHDAARPAASQAMLDRVFAAAGRLDAVIPGLPVSDTLHRAEPDDDPAEASAEAQGTATDVADAILGLDPLDPSGVSPGGASGALERHRVVEPVDRAGLFAVQTPQVFERALLVNAYAELGDDPQGLTDDASVVLRAGGVVRIVAGDPTNLKLTRPGDAPLLEAILAARQTTDARDKVKELWADEEDRW
ncbi:MAG: IspD/TarI family cytidylyltransferase [Planctomycetota bacterium]